MASPDVAEAAKRVLDRPVFILGAPRSGSTLLFELLSQAQAFWTVGGESHAIFESIPALQPNMAGNESNRLTAEHSNRVIGDMLISNFLSQLRDHRSVSFANAHPSRVRMLEKTPKNALRLPFLNAIFPDALFIYLYRDARENLSSIMEAWRSGRFVTYRGLPGWNGDWSLLLPPGWRDLTGQPLERIAAFQWEAANRFILDDLEHVAPERWTCVNYADLILNAGRVIRRLCVFSGVSFDKKLERHVTGNLPISRYTLTKPAHDKWRKNEKEINSVLPFIEEISRRIEIVAAAKRQTENRKPAGDPQPDSLASPSPGVNRKIGRNELCYCGSGRKYKHCHG